jgi:hypothetical protein
VGRHSGMVEELNASPFKFERLSLQFLQPEAILEIMKGTYCADKTLLVQYELNDTQAMEVAVHLYSQTTGIPRSLLQVLQSCTTYHELMSYSRPRNVQNFREFHKHISLFKDEIQFILGRVALNETVDLRAEVHFRGKYTSRERIVNNAFMAWHGWKYLQRQSIW